jgi:imidazole glycerol-phosphate synthase subunit HisH
MSAPPEIAVVDYGAGNLRSVAKALERSGLKPTVTGDPEALPRASGVVLPGVGNFAAAAERLRSRGLAEALAAARAAGRPYLGLCLGLQLLFDESEEHGRTPGFGWLAGRVERFPGRDAGGRPLRVPHIGWNRVRFRGNHPMIAGLPPEDTFYFVHGYRAVPADPERIAGVAEYGGEFAAAVADEGVFAVQFHPEKSQWAGKRLLDAFASWLRSS